MNKLRRYREWPAVGTIDMRVVALLCAWFYFKQPAILWTALALQAVVWIGIRTGMNVSMLGRWVITRLFGGQISHIPLHHYRQWYRNLPSVFALSVVALVSVGAPVQEASADYMLIDSLAAASGPLANQPAFSTHDMVSGGCEACDLDITLRAVVPSRFTVVKDDAVARRDIPVTWYGPITWGEILQRTAIDNDLLIEILARQERVILSQAPQGAGRLAIVSGTDDDISNLSYRAMSRDWQLEVGKSLKENMIAWGEKVGYFVDWSITENYMIDYPASFEGDIRTAMTKVLLAYQDAGVMVNIVADFRPDNTTIVFRQARENRR